MSVVKECNSFFPRAHSNVFFIGCVFISKQHKSHHLSVKTELSERNQKTSAESSFSKKTTTGFMYANRIVKKKKQFVVNFTTHTLILE